MWTALALACPSLCLAQFPAELDGTVSDAATGGLIPSATVHLIGGAVVQTQADGTFQLRGLDPGVHALRVVAIGYQPQDLTLTLANGERRTLAIRLFPAPVVLPELVAIANRQTPGVTLLDRGAIQQSGRADLGGLLEGQTGVLVERRGGPAGPATISIRGSSSGQVLVLLDGTPLNDALTGSADLSLVALETLDSVVIRRGGASERYGSRALGGVVELYSRRSDGSGAFGLGARAGAWGERGVSGSLSAGHRSGAGRFTAQANGSLRNLDGDFEFDVPEVLGGGTEDRINAGSEQRAVQASTGYEWQDGEFRVRGDWLHVDRGMPGTAVQQTPFATQQQRRLGGGVGFRLRGAQSTWYTDLAVQHQRAEFQDSAPPASAPYHDSLSALNVTAQSAVDLTRGAWSLSGGVDLRTLRAEGSALNDSAPESQNFGGLWGSVALRRPWGRDGFAQFSAAARGDAGTGIGDPVLSPKLAASAGRGALSLTGTWGSSFSPPTLGDLFFQEGVQVRANPALQPERVRNEVTLSASLREQPLLGALLRSTLTVYRADIDDMILWSPDFRYIWSPNNFDVKRRGFEAEIVSRIPSWSTELGLGGGLNDLTYVGPVLTGQVIYRPRWTANGRLDVTQLGIRSGLVARFVGERRTGIGSELNLLPAFITVDLHLSRDFRVGKSRLELSGGVDNLFDQRHTLLVAYPSPGRSWWLGTRLSLGQDAPASDTN